MRLLHASILHIKTEKQPFPFTFVCVRAGMGKGCCFRQYEDQAAQKNIEKARQNSGRGAWHAAVHGGHKESDTASD